MLRDKLDEMERIMYKIQLDLKDLRKDMLLNTFSSQMEREEADEQINNISNKIEELLVILQHKR